MEALNPILYTTVLLVLTLPKRFVFILIVSPAFNLGGAKSYREIQYKCIKKVNTLV